MNTPDTLTTEQLADLCKLLPGIVEIENDHGGQFCVWLPTPGLPEERIGRDVSTTAGCAVRLLAGGKVGLCILELVAHVPSPAKSRRGSTVKKWRLAPGKRALAIAWLERNGFERIAEPVPELPFFTTSTDGATQFA